MATERMVSLVLGLQGLESLEDGLDDVRWSSLGEPPIGVRFVAHGHARLVVLGEDLPAELPAAAHANLVEDGLKVISNRVGGDV